MYVCVYEFSCSSVLSCCLYDMLLCMVSEFQIFRILRIPQPYKKKEKLLFEMADLGNKKYESIKFLFKLCYRVIEHSQKDYRKNQVQ